MANNVLSIEIGYSLIRIMEGTYKAKKPKIKKTVSVPTPENAVEDGMITNPGQLAVCIRDCLTANKIKTRQVVFSINTSKIASRLVTIPKVSENKIGTLVETNASDYFPYQLDDYVLGYKVMGVSEADKNKLELMVYAAQNKMLNEYKALAETCGLTVVGFDHSGNSLYQAVKNEASEQINMVIKLDERNALISVLQGNHSLMQRTIAYGVEPIIYDCMETENLDYQRALEHLRHRDYLRDEDVGVDTVDAITALNGGVQRVVDFYNSSNAGKPVEKIFLTGLGGDFVGLAAQLSGVIGIPTGVLSDTVDDTVEKQLKNVSLGEYIVCLGALISPVGFIQDEKKKKNAGKDDSDTTGRAAVIALAGSILVSGVLVAVALIPYLEAKNDNTQKKLRLESLKEVESIYNEYSVEKAENEYLNTLELETKNRNHEIVAFIEELEKKMPSDIKVSSMVCSEESAIISLEVANKNEAADVLDTLQNFKSLAEVNVASVSDDTDTDGVRTVSFTVQCVYYPYDVNVEEETDELE